VFGKAEGIFQKISKGTRETSIIFQSSTFKSPRKKVMKLQKRKEEEAKEINGLFHNCCTCVFLYSPLYFIFSLLL